MNDEQWKRVRQDLDVIRKRLGVLISDQRIWDAVNERVGKNPAMGQPGDVLQWITVNHFTTQGTRLRNLFEIGSDTVSLGNIVRKLADGGYVVTREDYIGLYTGLPEWHAHHGFDHLCRDKEARCYPKELAQRHLRAIDFVMTRLKPWVDKRVAHWDKAEPTGATLYEFRRAIRVAVLLHRRMYSLFNAAGLSLKADHLLSVDWWRPLTIRWFDPPRECS